MFPLKLDNIKNLIRIVEGNSGHATRALELFAKDSFSNESFANIQLMRINDKKIRQEIMNINKRELLFI